MKNHPTIIPVFLFLISFCRAEENKTPFVHPGLLHTAESLERIRRSMETEPWKSAFERFRNDHHALFDYKVRGPFDTISRIPGKNKAPAEADHRAAYFNALMWSLTGEHRHAEKAIEILDGCSERFEGFSPDDRDLQLTASLGPFFLVNAAEILRYTDSGWKPRNIERFERFLKNHVLPAIRNFATHANGNWDTACIKTVMAIGVFCNDRKTFDLGIDYFKNGTGNGRLTYYVINTVGQCQESGRDQQHTQLGLGHLAEAAEIAWNQGVDLYALNDNRLLAGFEYTARYNLGEDVPFQAHVDTTGKYRHTKISDRGRGELRPIFEMVWNHYGIRKKLDTPWTRRATEELRPEGPAPYADHPGYGTLLFLSTIP